MCTSGLVCTLSPTSSLGVKILAPLCSAGAFPELLFIQYMYTFLFSLERKTTWKQAEFFKSICSFNAHNLGSSYISKFMIGFVPQPQHHCRGHVWAHITTLRFKTVVTILRLQCIICRDNVWKCTALSIKHQYCTGTSCEEQACVPQASTAATAAASPSCSLTDCSPRP